MKALAERFSTASVKIEAVGSAVEKAASSSTVQPGSGICADLLCVAVQVQAESLTESVEERRREIIEAIGHLRPNTELEAKLAKQRAGISSTPGAVHAGGCKREGS